jgi:hypothetical protein
MATAAPAAAAPVTAAAPSGGLLGSPAAAAALHHILGTSIPLHQITQVKMVMGKACKMGISFWPSFRFKPPERDEKAGTAKLVTSADTPPEMTAAGSSTGSSSNTGGSSSSAAGVGVPGVSSQLLHVNFTQEPPDEFSVGAKFLGGIPFPFITIRTTKLEGTIDPFSGAVVLLFEAQFLAGVGSKKPTALTVNAHLTTEPAKAFKKTMEGERLDHGNVTLVSAAEVPKTSSWFANLILWLPTAATAVLPMRLEFS